MRYLMSKRPLGDRWRKFSKKKILKGLFSIFVFLLVLGIIWTTKFYSEQKSSDLNPIKIGVSSPYKWAVGECKIYRFTYSSSSSSDFRVLFGDIKSSGKKDKDIPTGLAFSFDTSVEGEVETTMLEQREQENLVAYRMRNLILSLIVNGYNDTQQADTVKKDLEKEIFVLISPQGKILSVFLDNSMSDLAQSYARQILALTQFVFPIGQTYETHRWEVHEEDPSGFYIASYQIYNDKDIKDASLKSFSKKKIRYIEHRSKPKTGTVEVPKIIIPDGRFIAHFDFVNGRLSSLKGSESQTILINNKKVGGVTNNFHIAFLKKEILNTPAVSSLKSIFSKREKETTGSSLFVKQSSEKAEYLIHKRELKDATLESLLAELKKAESDPNLNPTALYLKFKALIYLHPESCKILGKLLSSADYNSLTMNIIPKALSTIGHSQAQLALVEAIKSRLSDKFALFMLINPLATVNEPIQEAEETLKNLAFNSKDPEISAMAQLALGAQARRIASISPERVVKIVDRFIQELKSSSSPEMTKQLLLALGNAGSSRALEAISNFATSPSPDIRATALHALRFIDSVQAETLIIKGLLFDPDRKVRLAAANALGYREMTEISFKAQKDVFLKDSDVEVRLKILENLWKAQQNFPEVRQLIKKTASEDSSEEVRKAAKNIMIQYPENYFKD